MAPLSAKTSGMDAYMNQHKLDAVLFAGSGGCVITAKAGYPSVMVLGGFVSGVDEKETPDYPLGVTFAGRAWSEHKLLRLAYAFEQASNARLPPPGLVAREGDCASRLGPRRSRDALDRRGVGRKIGRDPRRFRLRDGAPERGAGRK